jgi:hypothetical protein
MIRFITCLRRRPELSTAEFRSLWNSAEFDALIQRTADMAGALRHVKSSTLVVDANNLVQAYRGTDEPFDGVLEYFLPGAAGLMKHAEQDVYWDLQHEMVTFQERMADMSRSVAFFTDHDYPA